MDKLYISTIRSRVSIFTGLCLLLLTCCVDASSVVESRLASGVLVTAEYQQGDPSLPTVMIIHGFLQTRNYLTVNSLFTSLADNGYTVLAPTLSLGIQQRKQSLSCGAIHTHTMDEDVTEIDYWVQWLIKHNHQNIVLLGHSYGSLQSLVYYKKEKNPKIKKIIATSLVDVEHVLGEDNAHAQYEAALKRLKNGDQSLSEYKISYCKQYLAPPSAFISYASWSKQKIVDILKNIAIPVDVILGGKDDRMGKDWPGLVKSSGAHVTIIDGANHFFDASFEFDLLDLVTNSLTDHRK
jgi:pimeloyl-ACP methyl ester carboxylesterase